MSNKPDHPLKTREYASRLGLAAETVRRAAAEKGSYYGDTPTKLPNGQLRWPDPFDRKK